MTTEIIVILIISAVSLILSFFSGMLYFFERKKNDLRRLNYEDQIQRIMLEARKVYDFNNESSYIKRKGFSDEYEESIYLLKRLKNEISNLKSEIRNTVETSSTNIDVDKVSEDIAKNISQKLNTHLDVTDFSQLILHEMSNNMSFDHFKELKKSNLETKVHDTYKTIQHIQHILRTPISGLKINLKTLK